MHQRRGNAVSSSDCCCSNDAAIHPTSSSSSSSASCSNLSVDVQDYAEDLDKKRALLQYRQGRYWRGFLDIRRRTRTTSPKNWKTKNVWTEQDKEDLLILVIQLVCVCTIVGCAISLLCKFLFFDDGIADRTAFLGGKAKYPWAGGVNPFAVLGGRPGTMGTGRHPYPKTPLKPSSVYSVPDAMAHIGDKSDEYAQLRLDYDQMQLPPASQALHFAPQSMDAIHHDHAQVAYDIYNCPQQPPEGYPFAWKLMDILNSWPADDPLPRSKLYNGLCVFDYQKDYDKALTYRQAELPFVVQNDPQVAQAAARWNAPGFMERLMGNVRHRAEYSVDNHFMYWNAPPTKRKNRRENTNPKLLQRRQQQQQRPRVKGPRMTGQQRRSKGDKKNRKMFRNIELPEGWTEPTKMMRMTYAEWLNHANVTDDKLGPDQPHWYFRLIGCGETGPLGQCDAGSSEYLFDELPFFQPKKSLYVVEPEHQKGIHCRFGMKGVIAENHFDGSRNAITVLGGERRYILAHPDQCDKLALYPLSHPSARHSEVDWSNPDVQEFPEFELAMANEVVLQAGDVLYLPTNWFHYIISLSLNFQCNTRSGITQEYMPPIQQCGF